MARDKSHMNVPACHQKDDNTGVYFIKYIYIRAKKKGVCPFKRDISYIFSLVICHPTIPTSKQACSNMDSGGGLRHCRSLGLTEVSPSNPVRCKVSLFARRY